MNLVNIYQNENGFEQKWWIKMELTILVQYAVPISCMVSKALKK
jgi:hypothetical protein